MIILRKILLILITILTFSGTALAVISYTLSPVPDTAPVYTGDNATVSFSIKNYNFFYTGMCASGLDSGTWSPEFLVSSGSTVNLSLPVQAPPWGSGSGKVGHTLDIYCYDLEESIKVYKNTSFNLTYIENPEYIAGMVERVISSALFSINNAQNTINETRNLGADVTLAEVKLISAKNSLQVAVDKQSSMNSYFSSSDYDGAAILANDSKSYADAAKADADSAYNMAVDARIKYVSGEGQIKLKLAAANTSYDDAIYTMDKIRESMTLLPGIGVETSRFNKELEKVSSTLEDAKKELDKATSSYENKNPDETRAYSEKSLAITEQDITILKGIQNNMTSTAIERLGDKYSSASSNYDAAAKAFEESRTTITEDVYIARKVKLDNARKNLDIASNLITQAKSYADSKRYMEALVSLNKAFSELERSESLSAEVNPVFKVTSFEAPTALAGAFIAFSVILKRKRNP